MAPSPGIAGIFGFEEEKCVAMNIPAQTLTQIISGTGQTSGYILEYDLKQAKKIRISASYIPLPKNTDDLQEIYATLDQYNANVIIE